MRAGDHDLGEERAAAGERRDGRAKEIHARIAVRRIDRRASALEFGERAARIAALAATRKLRCVPPTQPGKE